MRALLVVIAGLGLPGFLPALAVARRSPAVVFLAPLVGAAMAAVAVELELGIGQSLLTWYVVVAVAVNVTVVAWWLAAGRSRPPLSGLPWTWSIATVAVVLGAMIVPLLTLRIPMIGYDPNAIWLTHTLMVSGGHHALLTGLHNITYRFSNPDYPPLVPAAGALAFAYAGRSDLHVAIAVTVLLNACALGVVGAGVATAGSRGSSLSRAAALVAAGAVCVAGFAVAGLPGLDGYADLLWAAAAVAAIVWGLVLPTSGQALGIAWTCAAVASLTKNEGLTTALVVLTLIALRYRPLTLPRFRRRRTHAPDQGVPDRSAWPAVRSWAERAGFVVVPALPGLAWAGLAHLIGLRDAFFSSPSTESPLTRASATVAGIGSHLAVAPVALAVLVLGCCVARTQRQRCQFANPAWLWTAWLFSLAIIFSTYVAGHWEIHWWLMTSVDRTTIFAQLLLDADLAIWLVIALDGAAATSDRSQRRDASPAAVAITDGPGGKAAERMHRAAAPGRGARAGGSPC